MAYDIGPVIGVEGEREFRDAINNINTNMRTLGTEMMAVTSKFDKNEKSTESLTAKNTVLNKQIDEQKNKLSELSKGLAMSAEKYGENDKVTQGWRQAVNKATADLNNMERELDGNTKALDEFGNETDQATEKTGKFSGALSGLGKGLADMGKVTAKAAIAGMKAVATAAVAAGTAMVTSALSTADYAGEISDASQRAGVGAEEFQKYAYAAKLCGMEQETLEKVMTKSQTSFADAKAGSKTLSEAYNQLGIDISKVPNSEEAFEQTIAALADMTDETQRNALANDIFGKSYAQLAPLLSEGSDGIEALKLEAESLGIVMSGESVAAGEAFGDSMDKLKTTLGGIKNIFGASVFPVLTEFVRIAQSTASSAIKAAKDGNWSEVGNVISEGFKSAIGKITDMLPGLMTLGSSIIGGLAGALVAAVPEVLPPLIDATIMLLNTIITILTENGPMLITAGMDALMMLINGIVSALPGLTDATLTIIMTLIDSLINLLPELIPAALAIIVALANGLIENLPSLIEKIPMIVETIVNVLVENLPLIINAALQIIMALAGALIQNIPIILESVIRIVGAILKGLISGIVNILTFVPKLFSSLITEFGKINWGELGINIIKGIAAGVASAAKNLANGVVDAAKGALNGAKNFLGIQSPSRVFRDQVGNMIGAGMAAGISDSAKEVDAAMNGLNNKLVADSTININALGTTGNGSSSSIVNVQVPVVLDGQVISTSSGRIQYGKNKTRSRALGVTV